MVNSGPHTIADGLGVLAGVPFGVVADKDGLPEWDVISDSGGAGEGSGALAVAFGRPLAQPRGLCFTAFSVCHLFLPFLALSGGYTDSFRSGSRVRCYMPVLAPHVAARAVLGWWRGCYSRGNTALVTFEAIGAPGSVVACLRPGRQRRAAVRTRCRVLQGDCFHNGLRPFFAACLTAAKAEEMRSRAANIERAADRAIYSDDPDAIEALTARIAGLEAQRDGRKARNAAFREEHRAELKAMTPYQRSETVPFPAYSIANVTADIARNKKRLAALIGEE